MNHLAARHEYVLRNQSMSLTVAMLDMKLSLLKPSILSRPVESRRLARIIHECRREA